ncbi:hypothetical protein HanPI659440_Chr10g0378931 [Helianthus annuus]|nr:hypothetical protein HanPI659440_Chr10g0378931 [Helianthus annuus]
MRWRFKDQTMSFDLGEDFVFNRELARALIEHKSPIRPLHEHYLLLGRLCFQWSQRDRDWPVIRQKSDHFDLEDQGEGEVPLMKQVASSAQEIRPVPSQDAPGHFVAEATSSFPQGALNQDVAETTSIPLSSKDHAGSSSSQAGKKSILDDVDSDPEIRNLDEALNLQPPSASLQSKGSDGEVKKQTLTRKRKTESLKIRSSDDLPMPKLKKGRQSSSHSGGDVMIELDEHLTGGKFSREEAALARSKPTPVFSGGFLPVNEVEGMDVENPEVSSKRDGKTSGEHKVVTFSGTILGSSLGPDCFAGEEEDQVSSCPPSWFGPELMSFFRYADMFSDDMEIDPSTAEDKFVPDWDVRNKDSVMDELVARTFLFNISTPVDYARSRKMKNQDLGAAVLSNQAQSNVFVTELYR